MWRLQICLNLLAFILSNAHRRIYLVPCCHSSGVCLENHSEMSAGSCTAADAFVVALFNVFSRMSSVPQALALVLQPYLERAQLWEQLHALAGKEAKVKYFWTFFHFVLVLLS